MKENIEKFVINFADIPYDRVSIERVLTGFKDLDTLIKALRLVLPRLSAIPTQVNLLLLADL